MGCGGRVVAAPLHRAVGEQWWGAPALPLSAHHDPGRRGCWPPKVMMNLGVGDVKSSHGEVRGWAWGLNLALPGSKTYVGFLSPSCDSLTLQSFRPQRTGQGGC